MRLNAYGIVTAHGSGAKGLAQGLLAGISKPTEMASGPKLPVELSGRSLAFYAPGRKATTLETLVSRLLEAWEEAAISEAVKADCAVVFASTKGCSEDFVWEAGAELRGDPFTPVVEEFLKRAGLAPKEWVSVSNACASSHSAVHLARLWFGEGVAKHVIVLAADTVGPFVLQGFHALHALSPTTCRPFHAHRDGLLLGEAAGVAVFSREGEGLLVSGTGLDCEGHAATRPEGSGASLGRAIGSALGASVPCAVIAHGTATQANDRAEDQAFRALPGSPFVSATKWSVGHCLGASGLVDLIAAAEWLNGQKPFAIGGLDAPDPEFRCRLLTPGALGDLPPKEWKRILVTSLGFGGVHGAITLERA